MIQASQLEVKVTMLPTGVLAVEAAKGWGRVHLTPIKIAQAVREGGPGAYTRE